MGEAPQIFKARTYTKNLGTNDNGIPQTALSSVRRGFQSGFPPVGSLDTICCGVVTYGRQVDVSVKPLLTMFKRSAMAIGLGAEKHPQVY